MNLKKIIFMFGKFRNDLTANKDIPIGEVQGKQLNRYYINFQEDPNKLNALIVDFDEDGVPLNTTYIDVEEKKLHYYPISIGQYALAIFHSYLDTKSEEKKAHFLRIADWFYDNRTEDDKLGTYWLTDVPKPEYGIKEAWKSGFSQSRGLSVLLRAWQLTNDDKYLEVCKRALTPFTYDIHEGGVTYYKDKNLFFFEEYVAEKPTMVLPAHPFVLFGIYDFIRAYKVDDEYSRLANKLFKEGLQSYLYWLPKFDTGWWVDYNKFGDETSSGHNPCTIGYLRLLITELEILYKITNNSDLEQYINKFSKYINLTNIIKMYLLKYKVLKELKRL